MSEYVVANRELEGNLHYKFEIADNSKSFVTLTQERVQQQRQSNMDREIDSLIKLMWKKYKRRSYMKRRQIISCMNGWTIAKVGGNLNGVLQTKIWKPRVEKEGNQVYEQQFKEARRSL